MPRQICIVAAALICASCGTSVTPEPQVFAPLSDLQNSGQAVARIYSALIPFIDVEVEHTWFVIKRADSSEFQRWERWILRGPYGYISKDAFAPEKDLGAGGIHVVDELVGPDAEPIVDFIETQSPSYPCRDSQYVVFPGPNSASYIQWVIDETGWQVNVPFNIIGVNVGDDCE